MSPPNLLPINPSRQLFRWGPSPAYPFYIAGWHHIFRDVRRHYPWPWPPHILIFQGPRVQYVTDDKTLRSVGRRYFNAFIVNARARRSLWSSWLVWRTRFDRFARRFQRRSAAMPRGEFERFYRELRELTQAFWLIVHIPEIANWGGEAVLESTLCRRSVPNVAMTLATLATFPRQSYLEEEEEALLALATHRSGVRRRLLHEHARRFHWILSSYDATRSLTVHDFIRRLRDLTMEEHASAILSARRRVRRQSRQRKASLLNDLHADRRLRTLVESFTFSLWWQDHRKGYIWQLQGFWEIVLQYLARERHLLITDLRWCWFKELDAIVAGGQAPSERIAKRRELFVISHDHGDEREYYGREARRILKVLFTSQSSQSLLLGLTVSRNEERFVRGRARVVHNPTRDGRAMRQGEILVTAFTEPHFVVQMRKARAIVTEVGGTVSHAAVISRELRIPCIVNTKTATRTLKTGDRIELDLDAGTVRKL